MKGEGKWKKQQEEEEEEEGGGGGGGGGVGKENIFNGWKISTVDFFFSTFTTLLIPGRKSDTGQHPWRVSLFLHVSLGAFPPFSYSSTSSSSASASALHFHLIRNVFFV